MSLILRLLAFTALTNFIIVAILYIVGHITGWLNTKFLSDYFFYAFLIQIGLGAILSTSPPASLRYLEHSTSKAAKVATSMVNNSKLSENKYFSSAEPGVGMKFLLSGLVSLLICTFI